MPTDHADKSFQHSGQGLPKDAACEACVPDIINPTGKGPCAPGNLPLLSWKAMVGFHQAVLGAAVRIVRCWPPGFGESSGGLPPDSNSQDKWLSVLLVVQETFAVGEK